MHPRENNFRLGRLPHDPAVVALVPAHRFSLIKPPAVVDRRSIKYLPNLYDNDKIGDCTCVAWANMARGLAALNGFDIDIEQSDVDAMFGAVGGTTDLGSIPGLFATDVIKWQAANGFKIAGNQSLVAQVGQVDLDRTALSHAMATLGALYLGVTLYEGDMANVGATWTTGYPKGKPVGGHMINGWDYDTTRVRVGTWGALQPATWDWLIDRLDEAYAPVWRQLAKADGTFYDGLTADGLMTELSL